MPQPDPQANNKNDDGSLMSRLQELLLEQERARVNELESEVSGLEEEIQRLTLELNQAREDVIPTVTEHMSAITQEAVEGQRGDMARALSPIIGEATRYQILNSREEMVEALYPIVGAAVVRAVGEALNELRQRIDSQIRPNTTAEQTIIERIRGVDPAELALRNALPFEIHQIFLIQHDSGLVLEFVNQESEELTDHDLISSMLTAIRSFVNDSFSPDSNDDELHEVQFGDERILLESGTAAYIAAVTNGIEPDGFRSLLRTLVNELHIQYKEELQEFDGDEGSLPDLRPSIMQFIQNSVGDGPSRAEQAPADSATNISENLNERRLKIAGIILAIMILGFCIFYGWLTVQLLPYALSGLPEVPEPIVMEVTRVVIAPTQPPEPTSPPTETATSTFTPVPTETPLPTSTLTPVPTDVPTNTPPSTVTDVPDEPSIVTNPVWSREVPEDGSAQYLAIPRGTPVEIIRTSGSWIEIRWEDRWQGLVTGWVKSDWVNIEG